VQKYVGVEISSEAAKIARILNPKACIIDDDVLNLSSQELGTYDIVVSLSCIDWNVEFSAMLQKAWSMVSWGGGVIVLSLRLTKKDGVNDIGKSYQFINFEGKKEGETAPYVVLNFSDWMKVAKSLPDISGIQAFGYYGTPSVTAVTAYERICFAVFALNKAQSTACSDLIIDVDLPEMGVSDFINS